MWTCKVISTRTCPCSLEIGGLVDCKVFTKSYSSLCSTILSHKHNTLPKDNGGNTEHGKSDESFTVSILT